MMKICLSDILKFGLLLQLCTLFVFLFFFDFEVKLSAKEGLRCTKYRNNISVNSHKNRIAVTFGLS